MESERDLYKSIFVATARIQEEYSELTKYMTEMPEHFMPVSRSGMKMNSGELQDYLESLNSLLETYADNY